MFVVGVVDKGDPDRVADADVDGCLFWFVLVVLFALFELVLLHVEG